MDFVGKAAGEYVVGKAKFLDAYRKDHQDEFFKGSDFLQDPDNGEIRKVFLLDGAIWLRSEVREMIDGVDGPVFSALLLEEYMKNVEEGKGG